MPHADRNPDSPSRLSCHLQKVTSGHLGSDCRSSHLVRPLDLLDPAVGPLGSDASVVVTKVRRLGEVDKEADLDDTGQQLDVAKKLRDD